MPFFEEEVLRRLLLEAIRSEGWNQVGALFAIVERTARDRDLFPNRQEAYYETGHLKPEDRLTVKRLIWELIIQGILVPGQDDANSVLPFLSVTPSGRAVLNQTGPTPYEPDEYLRAALEAAQAVNANIVKYLSESLKAFRRGLYLSSAVMLGVASESAFLSLSDLVASVVSEKFAGKIRSAPSLKKKHELVLGWLLESGVMEGAPELRERVETYLREIFQSYRLTRNDAGHPTSAEIPRDLAYANLNLFPNYVKAVADVVGFLRTNRIP